MFRPFHKYCLWDIKGDAQPDELSGDWHPRLVVTCKERIMSSYAKYCRDQAAECARRARLASSPDVAANSRTLELRWLKLAEKANTPGRPLGKGATVPVAMGARS